MKLSGEQLKTYEENGLLFLPGRFSQSEVDVMKAELPQVFSRDSPRRVVEQNGVVVRSVYGSHAESDVFRRLVRHPRLVEAAKQIVGGDVYCYQFKVNAKAAFAGDVWDWHQDYSFWRKEDGLPSPRVTNAAIFLDDVNDFNGPMFLIPGSHKEGLIDTPALNGAGKGVPYDNSPAWISNLTANLKYTLDKSVVASLVEKNGIVAPKGPAGSMLLFDGNVAHASPHNISPFGRVVVMVTFSSIDNIPQVIENRRPEFLVSRDYQPLSSLSDDVLLQGNAL
jgi:ectoine hydroxylase-related dioxygenase (phytanoyl-CoA dioxygenase family)